MAHLYRAQGLQRLDHVSFFFENNPRMLECEGGAERTGLYYTCINSYLAPDEAAYIINDSESRVVVTSAAKREVAMQLPELCPNVERWLMADVDAADAPFETPERGDGRVPDDAHRRRAARRGDALLVGHDGTAEGDPASAARRGTRREPLPIMEFVAARCSASARA